LSTCTLKLENGLFFCENPNLSGISDESSLADEKKMENDSIIV
jgi:hypothetical protein